MTTDLVDGLWKELNQWRIRAERAEVELDDLKDDMMALAARLAAAEARAERLQLGLEQIEWRTFIRRYDDGGALFKGQCPSCGADMIPDQHEDDCHIAAALAQPAASERHASHQDGLDEAATCKRDLQVRIEGTREEGGSA